MGTATEVRIYDPNNPYAGRQTGYAIDGVTYKDSDGNQRINDGTYVEDRNGRYYQLTGGSSVAVDNDIGQKIFNPSRTPVTSNGTTVPKSNDASATGNDYITSMYDAKAKAAVDALTAAYNQNVLGLQSAKDAIPGTYNEARNATAGQSEVQRRNFNQYAAENGLNSGAGGQAQLSFSNMLQSNLSSLDRQQAKDIAAADLQLAQLKAKYESDIAAAVADGKFQEAQALYNQYLTDQANARADRQFNAQMAQSQAQLDAEKDAANYNRSYEYARSTGDYSSMSPWYKHQAIVTSVGNNAWTMYQQKLSHTSIAGYLANEVDNGAITQPEAEAIMRSFGIA